VDAVSQRDLAILNLPAPTLAPSRPGEQPDHDGKRCARGENAEQHQHGASSYLLGLSLGANWYIVKVHLSGDEEDHFST
jgi:hypothetical protein